MFTGAGGLPTRLFSLLQDPHWALLGYNADDASTPAEGLLLGLRALLEAEGERSVALPGVALEFRGGPD
ncbi:hypothetical protein [Streptomyces sp. NPDC059092]|uniref:hypothetical protein n=1 Tax=Streptomyces sp. NPDC059092 TaxID=3346725 RepID=UPI0036BC2638